MGGFLSHLSPEQNLKCLDATCGPIRGNIYRHNDKIVEGYLGIPFAKAPIGPLRFKKPVASEKWAEPRDCYSYGPLCPQTGKLANFFTEEVMSNLEIAEDNCLTLNVFAPRWNEFPSGLPVMVYFYGGGFEIGTSQYHDYSISGTLPLKDVVLVTVNYRLGPYGFLTTGDDVAKGNYGLWDQALALQWVQDHIGSFRGDPQNVTIFGTSAGGVSVDLLALSPYSNRLFRRAMANSGSGFCDFAVRTKEVQAEVFKEFAEFHGYTGNDSNSLLAWYNSQPVPKFTEFNGFQKSASGFLHFVPNFDEDFFPEPFDELRRKAPKIDALFTVGEYEGLEIGIYILGADGSDEEKLKRVVEESDGPDITDDFENVRKKILEFYQNTDNGDSTKKLVEFLGDSSILASWRVRNHLRNMGIQYPMTANWPFKAASHGSEFKYILGCSESQRTPTEEELKVMDMLGSYVTNFAKYGDPNINSRFDTEKWEKYSLDRPLRYFKMDFPKCVMKDNFQNGRLEMYDEISRNGKQYQKIVYGKS